MITWDQFEYLVINKLERNIDKNKNPEQNIAISCPLDKSLFIVAGPGSGKTTAIVLKILKSIFVDDLEPANILAVTFTRKASSELKSRILGWGDQLRQTIINDPSYISIADQVKNIDFNTITTGTLDSVSEDIMGEYRTPGTPKPVVIENFVSNALMTRIGLFNNNRYEDKNLKDFIIYLRDSSWGLDLYEMSSTLLEIKDRYYNDQVDIESFRKNCPHPGAAVACDAIEDYVYKLNEKNLFDFAHLEAEFLHQLKKGKIDKFLEKIKLVVVDEYQDTNLLQEQIYLELAKFAIRKNGSIVVVGDDDQSLYRFRGATVDLFQKFQERAAEQLELASLKVNLSQNYRSTPNIVKFCNNYILLDKKYQASRVYDKSQIVASRDQPFENYPILGMFRNDVQTLAHDLASFIHSVIYGNGTQVQDTDGKLYKIIKDSTGGSIADVSILCSTPQENKYNGEPRLPFLLKHEFNQLTPNIKVFNPRGQSLETVFEVQVLCGLILECIDPDKIVQETQEKLPNTAVEMFEIWRNRAKNYINSDLAPTKPIKLKEFIDEWKTAYFIKISSRREVSLVDLIYKLVTWIPIMQDDVEGLVYLEAIMRTITQSALLSSFRSEIIFDPSNSVLSVASVKESLWNIFVPIASGLIKIDEELLETLPKDRLNIMSIHQAKGLEFPLVVVDVGSDFKINHHKQELKRFPLKGNKTCKMEDELRKYSILCQSRQNISDRAFDDLIRQYFVAYSRPKDVLLLVGLNSSKEGYSKTNGISDIPNIATGWDRSRNWIWGRGLKKLIHI